MKFLRGLIDRIIYGKQPELVQCTVCDGWFEVQHIYPLPGDAICTRCHSDGLFDVYTEFLDFLTSVKECDVEKDDEGVEVYALKLYTDYIDRMYRTVAGFQEGRKGSELV